MENLTTLCRLKVDFGREAPFQKRGCSKLHKNINNDFIFLFFYRDFSGNFCIFLGIFLANFFYRDFSGKFLRIKKIIRGGSFVVSRSFVF
jgi:hypothetical protein